MSRHLTRRQWPWHALALLAAASASRGLIMSLREAHAEGAPAATERVVDIVAQRFAYTPNTIVLKRGQPVTLAFRSLDFAHGFSAPDFGVRADLLPGQVTQVRLLPTQNGTFDFLCDNFCGEGHERMSGQIIVRD